MNQCMRDAMFVFLLSYMRWWVSARGPYVTWISVPWTAAFICALSGWMDGWISAVFLSAEWVFRNMQINKEEDVWDFDLRVFHEWSLNILKIPRSLLHAVMWRGISLSHRFTRPWFNLPKVWWCAVVFNNPEGPIAVCRRRCLFRNPCYHPLAALCVAEMDGGGNMELSWNGCFIIHQILFLSHAHPIASLPGRDFGNGSSGSEKCGTKPARSAQSGYLMLPQQKAGARSLVLFYHPGCKIKC